MKMKFCLLFAAAFTVFSCKKGTVTTDDQPPTKSVSFSETFYESSCTWDATGKPDCLLSRDVISAELFNFINTNLPEGKDLRVTNPALLSSSATANIAITQPSDVYLTFVYQSTSSNNTFGYYTFPSNQPPKVPGDVKKITYVFPDVKSNVPLVPGDKIKIGRFDAGTSIGFVLMQNAWDASARKPNTAAVHFCSDDVLNPEVDPNLKKHAVFINYAPENKILIGFEDANRTTAGCDHDFNDVVLYATVAR